MPLPLPLHTALFLAAVVIFVVFCIPALLRLRQRADQLAQTVTELRAEISLLIQDSRKLLHDVNELSTHANQQCDDVGRVIQTVSGWPDLVDRVVTEVGEVLEPPLLTAARNA